MTADQPATGVEAVAADTLFELIESYGGARGVVAQFPDEYYVDYPDAVQAQEDAWAELETAIAAIAAQRDRLEAEVDTMGGHLTRIRDIRNDLSVPWRGMVAAHGVVARLDEAMGLLRGPDPDDDAATAPPDGVIT